MAGVAGTCFMVWSLFSFSLISAFKDQVKVKPGEDVVLHCQTPRGAAIGLLEWIRPDLKSDGDVFFYRYDRVYENYQHPSFRGRVELRDPQMKDGDISVILKNVHIGDAGIYKCQIIFTNIGGNRTELTYFMNLTVADSGDDKDGGKTDEVSKDGGNRDVNVGLVAGLFVVVVLLVIVGFIIVRNPLMQALYQLAPEKACEQPPV